MRRWISASRSAWISAENSPASDRLALRAAASVLASIRSAMASAWARSILSFRKARSVNSPGRPATRSRPDRWWCGGTGLQAARQQQLQHHRPAMGLKFQHISPVYECGAGKVHGQTLVNGAAVGCAKGKVGGLARASAAARTGPG
jgi:hypothetical protein